MWRSWSKPCMASLPWLCCRYHLLSVDLGGNPFLLLMLFWDSEAISVTGKLLGTTDSLLGSRQVMDDFLCIKHCPQTIQKMPAVLDDCLWVKHCPLRSFRLTLSKKKKKKESIYFSTEFPSYNPSEWGIHGDRRVQTSHHIHIEEQMGEGMPAII